MIIKDLGVIEEPSGRRQHRVIAKCDKCGNESNTRLERAKEKYICKSCMLKERNTTHGLSSHPLKNVHNSMKQRCNNKKQLMYYRYGGRGIKVCDEWLKFENFYEWAIKNGYKEGLSIDRIDNDGEYSPKNCRWITIEENISRNAKLSKDNTCEIINMYKNRSNKVKDIASKFNIDISRIYQILQDKKIERGRYV